MVAPMRSFLWVIVGFLILQVAAMAEERVFTDYSSALKTAREKKRAVFLEFMSTGCSHCAEFKDKVLDSPAFKKFAAEKLVLVILDFHPAEPYTSKIAAE